MSNIYCSNCGTKHILGAKFCMNCGNSLGGFSNMNRPTITNSTSQKKNVMIDNTEVDEDGIPTTFKKPAKLAYEIEKPNVKYTGKDLFNAPPVSPNDRQSRRSVNHRKLSKEEFLAQSLKECSSRPIQDIDES